MHREHFICQNIKKLVIRQICGQNGQISGKNGLLYSPCLFLYKNQMSFNGI